MYKGVASTNLISKYYVFYRMLHVGIGWLVFRGMRSYMKVPWNLKKSKCRVLKCYEVFGI